jgi:hypothetical protein
MPCPGIRSPGGNGAGGLTAPLRGCVGPGSRSKSMVIILIMQRPPLHRAWHEFSGKRGPGVLGAHMPRGDVSHPGLGFGRRAVTELTPFAVEMRYDFEFWPSRISNVSRA